MEEWGLSGGQRQFLQQESTWSPRRKGPCQLPSSLEMAFSAQIPEFSSLRGRLRLDVGNISKVSIEGYLALADVLSG